MRFRDVLFQEMLRRDADKGGAGAGSNGEGGEGGVGVKEGGEQGSQNAEKKMLTLSQDDLNKILANNRREHHREMQKSLNQFQDLLKTKDAELESIRETLQGLTTKEDEEEGRDKESSKVDSEALDKKIKRAIEASKRESSKQLQDLNAKLEEMTARATQAEQKRRNEMRDRMLTEALQAADAIDISRATKFFKDDLAFDEESDSWVYKTEDGDILSVREGIDKFIPDWLKKAKVKEGGSGGKGSPRSVHSERGDIAKLEEELTAAKKVAEQDPSAENINKVSKAKLALKTAKARHEKA